MAKDKKNKNDDLENKVDKTVEYNLDKTQDLDDSLDLDHDVDADQTVQFDDDDKIEKTMDFDVEHGTDIQAADQVLQGDDLLAEDLDEMVGEPGRTVALGDDPDLVDQLLQGDQAEAVGGTLEYESSDSWTGEGDQATEKIGSASGSDGLDTNTIHSGSMGSSQLADVWRNHLDSDANPMMSIELPSTSKSSIGLEFKLNPRIVKIGAGKIDANRQIDYRLGRLVGEGGMGEVYSAKQVAVDRMVAFKRIRKTLIDDRRTTASKRNKTERKFLTEAHITASLDHPNIITIHDLGIDQNGNVFYCMEFVNGSEWHRVFDDLSVEENIEILMRVGDGISYAHSKDVIHRDLKPENVMIGKYRQVLIMDWGLAVELKKGKPTNLGGTPAYLAPEMAKGPKTSINKSSDIYLLGALLFHIATGKPPHYGTTVSECIQLAAKNKIREVGQLQKESLWPLVKIAEKAMETKQEDRYPSVEEFQKDIRAYLSQEQSISQSFKLAEKSTADLSEAESIKDYEKFSSALFGFREAKDLYPANLQAVQGVQQTKIAYANCALARNDFELGLSLLDTSVPDDKPLIQKITKEKRKVQSRKNLVRLLSVAAALMVVAFLVIISWAWNNQRLLNAEIAYERDTANEQRKIAVDAKEVAVAAEQKATETAGKLAQSLESEKTAKEKAVAAENKANESLIAEKAAKEKAVAAENKAKESLIAETTAKEKAVAAENKAKESLIAEKAAKEKAVAAENNAKESLIAEKAAKEKAVAAENKAMESLIAEKSAKEKAKTAEAAAKRSEAVAVSRLFNSNINLADSLIRDNQISQALSTLKTTRETENSSDFLGWEFQRLLHLCHQDVAERAFKDAVGFAPVSNNRMVVAYNDGNIDVWQPGGNVERKIETGTAIRTFDVSADGKFVALGSGQGSTKFSVWNLETGQPVINLSDQIVGNRVVRIEFSADGKRLVAGDSDARIYGWDRNVDSFGSAKEFERLHSEPVVDFAFADDGTQLASISPDGLCLIWDWQNHKTKSAYQHLYPLRAVAFRPSPDKTSNIVVCATSEGEVVILDASIENNFKNWMKISDADALKNAKSKIFKRTLAAHASSVNTLEFNEDGSILVTGGDDRVLRIWDFDNETEIKKLRGHDEAVQNLRVLARAKSIASISQTGQLRVWDVEKYEDQRVFEPEDVGSARFATFNSNGKRFVSGNANGKLFVWDTNDPTTKPIALAFNDNLGKSAAYLPISKQVVTSGTNHVNVWKNGRSMFSTNLIGKAGRFAVSNNEQWLVTGGDGGNNLGDNAQPTSVWDIATREKIGNLLPKGDRYRVSAMAISKDDRYVAVATGSTEGILFLFDLKTLEKIDEVEAHRGWISDLVFADNNRLVSADSLEGYANIWNVSDRGLTLEKKLNDVLGNYIKISFSPDRRRFVTSSNENYKTTLKAWDSRTFSLVAEKEFNTNIQFIEFRRDGQVAFLQADGRRGSWSVDKETNTQPVPFRNTNLRGRIVNGWSELPGDQMMTYGAGFTYLTSRDKQVINSYGNVSPCVDAQFVLGDTAIVALYEDGLVRVWDIGTREITRLFSSSTSDKYIDFDVSPDGKSMVVANATSLRMIDVASGEQKKEVTCDFKVASVAWPTADAIYAGADQGKVVAWNLKKDRQSTINVSKSGIVTEVRLSTDQMALAVLVKQNRNDDTGRLVVQRFDREKDAWQTIAPDDTKVSTIGLFDDGIRLVTGNQAGTITVWKVPTLASGQALRQMISMAQNDNAVTGISISPDSRLILSSSADGKSVLWLTSGWNDN